MLMGVIHRMLGNRRLRHGRKARLKFMKFQVRRILEHVMTSSGGRLVGQHLASVILSITHAQLIKRSSTSVNI